MNTQELYNYLHEQFEYIEGKLMYIKRPSTRIKIGQMAKNMSSNGRLQVCIKQTHYLVHRLVFLYHHGYLPKFIDHIDRDFLNNKIENLREVTISQNNHNVTKRKTNTSGYKGVSWSQPNKKWKAQISVNKKKIYLGYYPTPELAYQAYCEFVKANLPIYHLEA